MPKIAPEKIVTLKLETWQARVVQDFLKALKRPMLVKQAILDFKRPFHTNTYRVLNLVPRDDGIEFYLTDKQIAQVQELTGMKGIETIRITPAMMESQAVAFK